MRRSAIALLTLVAAAALAAGPAAQPASAQTKLLRFPDIHGDQVAFVYAGDIWTAPADGGRATRLTAHPGLELFPKFSPDGEWIAFTGQYDGDEQVYVIPTAGGEPKQLTYYPAAGPLPPRWGFDNQVYGWSPDGSEVLFRSMRYGWDLTDTQLFLADVDGGLPEPLPMPISGAGDLSPDGAQVAYSPLIRDFRSWKRYQGGWAQDLWIFDLESHDARQITDHPRTDRDPMWIGDRVFFSSDRSGTLNLYVHDLESGATEQLTESTRWDVRWPSTDHQSRIVYELGGELQVYDVATGESTPAPIEVPTDALPTRPSRISVGDDIEGVELAPEGKRALFVARGDVFTVPIEHGPVRNLTRSSDAHDRLAVWSPDGARIAFVSDETGEEQLYVIDQDGSGEPQQLTEGLRARLYAPRWSPDSSKIALSDQTGKLYVVDAATGETTEIADNPAGFLTDHAWAPDSAHLAFSMGGANGFNSLYVWSADDGQVRRITDEIFNEYGPSWSPKGDYLFYLSDRSFAPQIGSFEWNYVADRETGIFALALRDDVEPLLPPRSDEVEVDKDDEAKDDGEAETDEDGDEGEKKEDDGPEPVEIDWDGLAQRVVRIPVSPENYFGVQALDGRLLYIQGPAFFYGRAPASQPTVQIFSFEEREAKDLVAGIQGGAVSPDGSKIIVQQGGSYKLYDTKPGGEPKPVSTSDLEVFRDPEAEWAQIFDEVWRRYRDFFYVENMHGYDWEALRDQYRPLLEHVGHRSDLNYLISEMIAELVVSHAYIAGGDYQTPDRPDVALPGARFELDPEADRYRIGEILEGQNEEEKYRSPLEEIGVELSEGDYVLAIDGEELTGSDNPYRMLRYKADRPVELTVNSTSSMDGSRKVAYEPITDEDDLIYLEWITDNRQKVEEATDGRVGYIHVPDMGANGIWEFIKHYYGQLRKDGLIIDVRNNGGGNVSGMLIERLRRELLSVGYSRNTEFPDTYPGGAVFHGHLVCLINEVSASDGDIFPAMFREAGLGPLIGKRTWGGVIGISGRGPLIDGGQVFVPEFGFVSKDGDWSLENRGVVPDIEVDNDPESVIEGRDPQLQKGIEVIMEKIRENPKEIPERPAPPVKTPGDIPPAPGS